MKLESAAGLAVLFTAYWIVCSFAYVSGVFMRYDTSLVGLITLDEVIVSSAGRIATVFALIIPLCFISLRIIDRVIREHEKLKKTSEVTILAACSSCVGILGFYLLLARSDRYIFVAPGYILMTLATIAPVFIGVLFDFSQGGKGGRFVAIASTGLLFSFASGAEPGFFPEAGVQKCVEIHQSGTAVASGPLLYATPSAIVLRERTGKALSYYRTADVKRVSSVTCRN